MDWWICVIRSHEQNKPIQIKNRRTMWSHHPICMINILYSRSLSLGPKPPWKPYTHMDSSNQSVGNSFLLGMICLSSKVFKRLPWLFYHAFDICARGEVILGWFTWFESYSNSPFPSCNGLTLPLSRDHTLLFSRSSTNLLGFSSTATTYATPTKSVVQKITLQNIGKFELSHFNMLDTEGHNYFSRVAKAN